MKEKEMRYDLNLQLFGEDPEPNPNPGDPNPEQKDSLADVIKKQQEKIKNMVDKEDYNKLMEENSTLKDVVLNGGSIPNDKEQGEENLDEKIKMLRKQLFSTDNQDSNLEYATKAVELRKAILKRDGYDIFAPKNGANGNVYTQADADKAVQVNDVLEECIKSADGDSGVFTAILSSKLADDSPALVAMLNKRNKQRR